MRLALKDYHPQTGIRILTERTSKKLPRSVIMQASGRSQASDTKNENERIYKRTLWEKQLNDAAIQEKIANRQMLGHFGHPKEGQEDDWDRFSHIVTSAKLEDDGTVNCTYDILDTPAGQVVATMYEAGVRMGVSSRGEGSIVTEDNQDYVDEDDYYWETMDFVLNPSTPDAYPSMISEGVEKRNKSISEATLGLVSSTEEMKVLHSYSEIEESVLLPEVIVHRNCRIRRAIIDRGCEVPEGTVIGYDVEQDKANGYRVTAKGVVLVTRKMLGQREGYS